MALGWWPEQEQKKEKEKEEEKKKEQEEEGGRGLPRWGHCPHPPSGDPPPTPARALPWQGTATCTTCTPLALLHEHTRLHPH